MVVVDEAGRFAIPLVGGHVGGANELSRTIAEALGGTAVVSTATDSLGVPALDQLGWAYEGDVAGVTGSIIAGLPVLVIREQPWPLPPLPKNVTEDAESRTVWSSGWDVTRAPRSNRCESFSRRPSLTTVWLLDRSLVWSPTRSRPVSSVS